MSGIRTLLSNRIEKYFVTFSRLLSIIQSAVIIDCGAGYLSRNALHETEECVVQAVSERMSEFVHRSQRRIDPDIAFINEAEFAVSRILFETLLDLDSAHIQSDCGCLE